MWVFNGNLKKIMSSLGSKHARTHQNFMFGMFGHRWKFKILEADRFRDIHPLVGIVRCCIFQIPTNKYQKIWYTIIKSLKFGSTQFLTHTPHGSSYRCQPRSAKIGKRRLVVALGAGCTNSRCSLFFGVVPHRTGFTTDLSGPVASPAWPMEFCRSRWGQGLA